MFPFDRGLSSLVVTDEDTAQITACLQRLIADSGARSSMLLDRAGQILAWESDNARPEMQHLGALVAATYASMQEMARLLNEDGFRTLLQEGMREKIFTETVQDQWLLVVIFDGQAKLGLIKVLAKRTSEVLANILEVVRQRNAQVRKPRRSQVRKATTDTIDLLFKDDSGGTDGSSSA
ncbi:MAG: roadblock/LC7 domain-containing protein [Sphaerobacter sp.]|nr:roadblock/LC7 domain-containing protein [Sphaerobacter sp.]